jgi:hypothetical protein
VGFRWAAVPGADFLADVAAEGVAGQVGCDVGVERADHPDALAVWEYLDRSVDPTIVGRAFKLSLP